PCHEPQAWTCCRYSVKKAGIAPLGAGMASNFVRLAGVRAPARRASFVCGRTITYYWQSQVGLCRDAGILSFVAEQEFMLYEGSKLSVQVTDGIAELCFDAHEGSVNKFDQATLEELAQAAAKLGSEAGIKGLLVTSAKPAFIVGADIMEFGQLFAGTDEQLRSWLAERANSVFSAIEDLPYPTVTAINGFALGGGLEMCLATDFRVMSEQAQVGLPETKLGIIPAFGGTVRLPRLIGADNAIEWIASGKPRKPAEALAAGAVEAVVAPDQLQAAARDVLQRAIAGEFDWQARARLKQAPLMLNRTEAAMVFQSARGQVMQRTKGMYPAPIAAVDCM